MEHTLVDYRGGGLGRGVRSHRYRSQGYEVGVGGMLEHTQVQKLLDGCG